MWIRVGQQRQSTLMLNKVLTSVDRPQYNSHISVATDERNQLENPTDTCAVLSDDKHSFGWFRLFVVAPAKSQDRREICRVFAFGGAKKDHRPKLAVNEVGLRTQPKPDWTWNRPHNAAVTMLRGNGGTFPSQAHKSDLKRCVGTGRRDALRRVILQVVQSVRYNPMYVPDSSEVSMVLTNLVYSGLGEYCPNRTRLN